MKLKLSGTILQLINQFLPPGQSGFILQRSAVSAKLREGERVPGRIMLTSNSCTSLKVLHVTCCPILKNISSWRPFNGRVENENSAIFMRHVFAISQCKPCSVAKQQNATSFWSCLAAVWVARAWHYANIALSRLAESKARAKETIYSSRSMRFQLGILKPAIQGLFHFMEST